MGEEATYRIRNDGMSLKDLLHGTAGIGRESEVILSWSLIQLDHNGVPLAQFHMKYLGGINKGQVDDRPGEATFIF